MAPPNNGQSLKVVKVLLVVDLFRQLRPLLVHVLLRQAPPHLRGEEDPPIQGGLIIRIAPRIAAPRSGVLPQAKDLAPQVAAREDVRSPWRS